MKYGFIGCGNMGSAIAKALSRTTTDFLITDRSGKAIPLAAEIGCTYTDVGTICREADAVFLAVKPFSMREVLKDLSDRLEGRTPLLISMAAGVELSQMEEIMGNEIPIIRIIPNTPVLTGKGLILYCTNKQVHYDQLSQFLHDLSTAGTLDPIQEELMDAASSVSGCGPAFVYQFIEALADGAVACGVPRAKALRYAAATVAGAGEMVLKTGKHPGELKDAVCSPGGSTIQGVRTLEQRGFRGAVMDAVISSCERNSELGD